MVLGKYKKKKKKERRGWGINHFLSQAKLRTTGGLILSLQFEIIFAVPFPFLSIFHDYVINMMQIYIINKKQRIIYTSGYYT